MAREALRKMEKKIKKLKSMITRERFFNCYSSDFSPDNKEGRLEKFLLRLKDEYKTILYVDVDIHVFEDCKDEEQEAKVLLELIDHELTGKGYNALEQETISITDALIKWSNTLDGSALLIFHCFHDLHSEKEKNILRSLRKIPRIEMSRYLAILILSNQKIFRWHLYPESDLDERHVAFSEY